MSRPTYENDGHLKDEEICIEAVEAVWGVACVKTPRYYKIDYCVVDPNNRVVGWIEIRCKNFARSQYRTFYTSLEKYLSVCRAQYATARPAFLLVKWSDGIFIYRVNAQDLARRDITVGGRTANSRGDDQDIEPVIHIPIAEFSKLSDTRNPF